MASRSVLRADSDVGKLAWSIGLALLATVLWLSLVPSTGSWVVDDEAYLTQVAALNEGAWSIEPAYLHHSDQLPAPSRTPTTATRLAADLQFVDGLAASWRSGRSRRSC